MVFHKHRTRTASVIHCVVGVASVAFGIVDVVLVKSMEYIIGLPVWFGAWVSLCI